MGRAQIKKKSTFIDMTAMSDVTVLLLTFFMLTSTFVKKEPVQVNTPASVSEIKIPETNVLQILVDPNGKIFMSLYFHPFVPYVAAAAGAELVFWIGGRLRPCTKGPSGFSRRLPKWAIGALAVVLVNWIVKNGLLILLGIPMIP